MNAPCSFPCDVRPDGSQHPFKPGQILNPYPADYRLTFAFSSLLYLLSSRPHLRSGFLKKHIQEDMRLTTFRLCHRMGEEPPLPRGNHALRTAMLEHGSSTPYLFGSGACSLLHLSILTRFISDSRLFSIPSFLAPYRVEAPRVDFPSRFRLHRQTPVGLRCHPGFPPRIAVPLSIGM